ncbi:autotransporter outer membrane beta-barrel domain-containing protein [Martelella mangrovi]|uniref:Outer membrane autotransporter protein n=1 Tax=Martelella mangrovi TaxID=1397477 RepID=A0ABV2IF77_9HYPH
MRKVSGHGKTDEDMWPLRRFGRLRPIALTGALAMAGAVFPGLAQANDDCPNAGSGSNVCAVADDPAPAAATAIKGARAPQITSGGFLMGAYQINRVFKRRPPGTGPFSDINNPDVMPPGSQLGPLSRRSTTLDVARLNPVAERSPVLPHFQAYPSMLMAMTRLPSFKVRTGGRYDDTGALASSPALDAVWGRFAGERYIFEPRPGNPDVSYKMSSFIMQGGIDGLFLDHESGVLIAGLSAHYQSGESKISSRLGLTTMQSDAYGIGATVLWLGSNGFYADTHLSHTRYSTTLQSSGPFKAHHQNHALGYALSLEVGQAIGITDEWSLVPQAQLLFSALDIERFSGPLGEADGLSGGKSLSGRAGLTIEKQSSWKNTNGEARSASVYGLINLRNEFLESSGNLHDFSSEPSDITGELGIGGSIKLQVGKRQVSAFGEVTTFSGFNTGSHGYGGNVGLRLRF